LDLYYSKNQTIRI